MEIPALLRNFGLSDKETAVYLALIELGPSSVRVVADRAAINRGTTYDILRALIAQGLVTYFHKQTKQFFVAEPPEKLLNAIDDREEKLAAVKNDIRESLPRLQAIFERSGNRPAVKFYEGERGMKQILQDILETMKGRADKTYFVYSSGTAEDRKHLYAAMPEFNKKRTDKKIIVRVISLGEAGGIFGLDERRQIPGVSADLKMTHELIYGGKIAHIGLDDAGNSVGVVVENESIYGMQQRIFEFNWQAIKK
ncbi:MAG: helix-turn-helix domain-containing protein [Patescibacteria group bacterium]